jgi:hypothetical protein
MNRELLQMALDALVESVLHQPMYATKCIKKHNQAIKKLKAELSKPEPKPAGWFVEFEETQWCKHGYTQVADLHAKDSDVVPLYRKEDL